MIRIQTVDRKDFDVFVVNVVVVVVFLSLAGSLRSHRFVPALKMPLHRSQLHPKCIHFYGQLNNKDKYAGNYLS